jgi:hypothetical protein
VYLLNISSTGGTLADIRVFLPIKENVTIKAENRKEADKHSNATK